MTENVINSGLGGKQAAGAEKYELLKSVNYPHELRRLDERQLKQLADELRDRSRLVAGVLDLAFGAGAPLERVLSDIDSDTQGHGKLLRSNDTRALGYGLAQAAPAIVRASLR